MKKFLDIVIFCLIIILIIIANKSFFGFSFNKNNQETVKFDSKLNIVEILYSKDFSTKVYGYGGQIPMAVGIDEIGVIKDIKILKNNETPEFLNKAISSGILNKWIGKDIKTAKSIKVDAISGATMSSSAIIKNMETILNNEIQAKEPINEIDIYKSLAILFVGFLGLFSFFAPLKANKIRPLIAGIIIFILGVWQGSMLSIVKISSWILNGVPDIFQIPLFLIFLVSIIIPMITGKNFYCYNLCPFGLSQDLVSKSIKLNIKIKVFKFMSYFRFVILCVCFVLLLFGFGFYIANIEPFSTFKPEFAPISAVIIFAISLIIATFNPRFWCRYFCPCGAFLDLFKCKK